MLNSSHFQAPARYGLKAQGFASLTQEAINLLLKPTIPVVLYTSRTIESVRRLPTEPVVMVARVVIFQRLMANGFSWEESRTQYRRQITTPFWKCRQSLRNSLLPILNDWCPACKEIAKLNMNGKTENLSRLRETPFLGIFWGITKLGRLSISLDYLKPD